MNTADTSPSSNGRGSEAWSRPWAHISLDRRSAGYCRVTVDHPPINTITATMTLPADSEFPPALADFFELVGRPGQQEQSARARTRSGSTPTATSSGVSGSASWR
jgi:hypothetical protein